MIARLQTAESVLAVGGLLDLLDGILHGVLDGDDVALEGVLGDFKEFALGFLHEVIDVDRLVEGKRLHLAAVTDEFARQILLSDDAGMEFGIGCAGNTAREFGDAQCSAYLVKHLVAAQLIGDGEHVDGLTCRCERLDSLVDLLIGRVIERLGLENLAHVVVGVFFQHESAQDGILKGGVLRRQFAKLSDDFGLMIGARATARLLAGFKFFHCRYVSLS